MEKLKVTALNKNDIKLTCGEMEIRVRDFDPKKSLLVLRMLREIKPSEKEKLIICFEKLGIPKKQYLILPPECEFVTLERIKK